MNDAAIVSGLEPLGDLHKERQQLIERNRTLPDPICQCLALDELHDQEARFFVGLETVQRRDVGMVQGRENARLPLEARHPLRVARHLLQQQLDRHLATQLRVSGSIHLAHAPGTEGRENLVVTELSTCL